jgi:23S rRNA (pseudouridine1915-N3)-methyltransferase
MRLRPNPDDAMPSGQVMARIVVHTHGKAREKGYAHLINKYAERLEGRGVKLVAHSDKLDHDAYVEKLKSQSGRLILLDENGESGTTEWILGKWKAWKMASETIHLAIGPVDGFEAELVEQQETMSLGPLTMTYEMAAVVLLEQLYRATEIERGSPYHRD